MRLRTLIGRVETAHWLAGLAVAVYGLVSLTHLDRYPPMGEDEPWLSATPYKLVTEGVYGTDLFAGYYGSEERDFQRPPLYHLLLAVVYRVFGFGVVPMRAFSAVCGLAILILTFAVGSQMGGRTWGALAVFLLVFLRIATGPSGVPLVDLARIGRNDIVVPVTGLAALWLFNRGARARDWLVGALAGLATLGHVYGAFWLVAFVLLVWLREPEGRRFARTASLGAGFFIVCAPWLAFMAAHWQDVAGQMRPVADRFELTSLGFYAENVVGEIGRYRFSRPIGFLLTVAGAIWIASKLKRPSCDAAFAVALAFFVHVVLFALVIKPKTHHYVIAMWPLFALSVAGFLRALPPLLRVALVVSILVDGSSGMVQAWRAAERTTPYDEFTGRVAALVPDDALVLGLQHYWMGLRRYEYRTWLLPKYFAEPGFVDEPVSLREALERLDPDVVLMDRIMTGYFENISSPSHPRHQEYLDVRRFLEDATLLGIVEDSTYGTMRVYGRNRELR